MGVDGRPAIETADITIIPAPFASIDYPDPLCADQGLVQVIHDGFTGGSYSIDPSGLTINSTTGEINTAGALPGTYTATYTIPPSGGCGEIYITT